MTSHLTVVCQVLILLQCCLGENIGCQQDKVLQLVEKLSEMVERQEEQKAQQDAFIEKLLQQDQVQAQKLQQLEQALDRMTVYSAGAHQTANGTVAFHSVLTADSALWFNAPVRFNEILVNDGSGYNSTTGVFTVPPGGDGLYYFAVYLLVEAGKFGDFYITLNRDQSVCAAEGDSSTSQDYSQAGCSGLVYLVEGDKVFVQYKLGTDTSALYTSLNYWNGFSGFQIKVF